MALEPGWLKESIRRCERDVASYNRWANGTGDREHAQLQALLTALGTADPAKALQRVQTMQAELLDVARRALLQVMEDWSEAEWCSGWVIGCERILWTHVLDAERQDEVTCELRRLSAQAGGWWVWVDDPAARECHRFVPLAEWQVLYAEMQREFEERNAAYRAAKGNLP